MADPTAEYLNALQEINVALTKGLETAIYVLEEFDKFSDEQRAFMIDKMKVLVEASQKATMPESEIH